MNLVLVQCCEEVTFKNVFKCFKKRKKRLEIKEIFFFLHQNDRKKKFKNLIPDNDIYLYLKVLKNGKIISVNGNYLKYLYLKHHDLLHKNINSIKYHKQLFLDYINPLFESSIENKKAYQFDFTTNFSNKQMVCSIYPCSIPDMIASADIIIRKPEEDTIKNISKRYAIV